MRKNSQVVEHSGILRQLGCQEVVTVQRARAVGLSRSTKLNHPLVGDCTTSTS